LGLCHQFLGQNFEAVLAVVVKLAGEAIFAKCCEDTLNTFKETHSANFH